MSSTLRAETIPRAQVSRFDSLKEAGHSGVRVGFYLCSRFAAGASENALAG